MPIPDYGAAPLAKTFMLVRGLSLLAMICIVGLTANFTSEIISTNVDPPKEVIGTLTVTSLATLYTLLTIPLFLAQANLSLLIMTLLDTLLLLAFTTVSILLGQPISFLNCSLIANTSASTTATSASAFAQSLASNLGKSGSTLGLQDWAGRTKVNCYEVKGVWGLCVALCVLFACSGVLLPVLWLKARRAGVTGGKGAA